jgi:hypothetical protein
MKSVRAFGVFFILLGIAAAQITPSSSDSPAAATGNRYIIAHFPWDGGFTTRVLFANNSGSQAVIAVSFFDPQNGQPKPVPLAVQSAQVSGIFSTELSDSLAQASTPTASVSMTIPPNDVSAIGADPTKRDATGTTQVAWATVSSNVPLNIVSVFDEIPSGRSAVSTAVGAQSGVTATAFRFPLSVRGPLNYDAGLAIANPNSKTATVTIKLLKQGGSGPIDKIVKTVPANGQELLVVSSSFAHDFSGTTLFNGALVVCSDQPIGFLALGAEENILFSTSYTNDNNLCP